MARTEWGPNKNAEIVGHNPDISLCMVTHLTDHPYHAHRREIVHLCLRSMLAGVAGQPYELIIWDNGSSPDFIDSLMDYKPAVVVRSVNVGVGNAQASLTRIARGRLICLTDDDVLFHPRWFYHQHVLLKSFPRVGEVSGSPQRTAFRWAVRSALDWGEKNHALSTGRMMPRQWEDDFAISLGRNPQTHYTNTINDQDHLLTFNGVKAWAHGHHMQMLAYRKTLMQFIDVRRSEILFDDARKLNMAIDEAGFLNLTTHERTAVHIGNVIDPSIVEIMREWGVK